jgi:exodeoxyribonuclease VII large subunit
MRNAQQGLDLATDSLSRRAGRAVVDARATLAGVAQKLQSHSPVREIAARHDRVRELQRRFGALPSRQLEKARQRFRHVEGILRVLGPDATLRRGYSITTTEGGKIVKSVTQVAPGNRIKTRVADGTIESKITS